MLYTTIVGMGLPFDAVRITYMILSFTGGKG
jgi:hypothetical protein